MELWGGPKGQTAQDEPKKVEYRHKLSAGWFKTARRLQLLIDNAHLIEGAQEYLDENFAQQYEIDLEALSPVPYWMDEAGDYGENIFVEYITGPVEPYHDGDLLELNDGFTYLVIGTQSLGEEQEHQAQDGGLCYEYRGYSYLRIIRRLTPEQVKFYEEQEEKE